MKISHSKLKGCVIIEPRVFGDERGFFPRNIPSRQIRAGGWY